MMSAVGRYLFTAAALLSLVLCLAAAGLWVWSCAKPLQWQFVVGDVRCKGYVERSALSADNGPQQMYLDGGHVAQKVLLAERQRLQRVADSGADVSAELARAEYLEKSHGGYLRHAPGMQPWKYSVNLQFVVGVMAIAPLIWLVWRHASRRLQRAGFCRCCGYDLRASPDLCPECGAVPEQSKL